MKPVKKGKKEIIWVLIYTKAKQEIKANENLQKQGFKTFLPLIAASNKNSELKSLVPVFPRYFFAQLNFELDNWTSIKSSYGVSHIVMFGEKFTSIPSRIIQLIQDKLDEEGIYKEEVSRIEFQEGDSVTIKEGRLAGINAIFLANKSKARVTLLLNLLNTTVNAEISKSDIGHKEVIKSFKL
jgi:transcriptional antiterminator RfaH